MSHCASVKKQLCCETSTPDNTLEMLSSEACVLKKSYSDDDKKFFPVLTGCTGLE